MPAPWKLFVRFFVSLRLTVVLLALSMVLIFLATLDQTSLGIYAVQQKWFRSFFVVHFFGKIGILYPGGYLIGGFLFLNLVVSHVYRLRLTAKKSGIWLTHLGLIVLLLGELFTGLWQDDYQMALDEGQTKSYAEHLRENELVLIDATDAATDRVVAIPEKLVADAAPISHPALPFRLEVRGYFPNAAIPLRTQVPNAAPTLATSATGQERALIALPVTYKTDERNLPAAYIDVIAPTGPLGTFLVGADLPQAESFTHAGKTWKIAFRFTRKYEPFSLTLLDFTHDKYPGTEIPKNFSSRVRLNSADAHDDREVLIYMNNPLRHGGLTFYQGGFMNNDRTSVLMVVRNPSWTLPYIACLMMTAGLLIQFLIHLAGFVKSRAAAAAPPPVPGRA